MLGRRATGSRSNASPSAAACPWLGPSPFGLIVNELVTNAIKHAFPDGRPGTTCVQLQEEAGCLSLSVEDDGVGLDGRRIRGTGMGQDNYLISADVPGASSRYVEKRFNDKVITVWTSGAAGDLCPIYDRNPSRFNGIDAIGRVHGVWLERGRAVEALRPLGLDAVRVVFAQEMEKALAALRDSGRAARLPTRKKKKTR